MPIYRFSKKELSHLANHDSNIDYLRIFCMLWIVMHHLSSIAIDDLLLGSGSILNYAFGVLFFIGGDIGNVVFIIITGYFMSTKKFDIKRFFRIWMEVIFYSLLGYVVAFISKYQAIDLNAIKQMLFPIKSDTYWFISTYMVMMFFFPVLNALLEKLDEKQRKYFEVVGIIVFSFLPCLGYDWLSDTNAIALFSILYILGGGYTKVLLRGISRAGKEWNCFWNSIDVNCCNCTCVYDSWIISI